MKIKNKTICILEALFQGHKVKLKYCGDELEFYWDFDRLCVDFEKTRGDEAPILHPIGFPDMTLMTFVKMCEEKTDNEVYLINTNMILINKNRNDKGERK